MPFPCLPNRPVERDRVLQLLREMLRIRRFEEKAAELYTLGKIRGFLHLYIGEEAVAVGAMQALTPTTRSWPPIASTATRSRGACRPDALMAEMYGKANGVQPGPRRLDALLRREPPLLRRQRDRRRRTADRRRPGSGRQAAGARAGDGLLLRRRRRRRGRVPRVAEPGGVVEAPGPVPLREQPLRHGHAPSRVTRPRPISRARRESYGICAEVVDGMDVLAVEAATRRGRGRGPARTRPVFPRGPDVPLPGPFDVRSRNSTATKEEVEQWKKRDPIAAFATRLREWRLLSRRRPGGHRGRRWLPRSTTRSRFAEAGRGSRSRI